MAQSAPLGKSTVLLTDYFENYDRITRMEMEEERKRRVRRTALENYLSMTAKTTHTGFHRMQKCRQGLEALDRRGWQRSFHQRMFHDNFIRACARIFWKREPHGAFARDHQKILEANGWDSLSGEVLVSTPRRFGKTISVSMFAAAMLYSCPNLEMSIYSTCKRISQKLLRNIQKFLELIYIEIGCPHMKEIRVNMEEIVLQGTECEQDVRVVNSYPSKVQCPPTPRSARIANARHALCPACRGPPVESSAQSAQRPEPQPPPAGPRKPRSGSADPACARLQSRAPNDGR
jgi:hypothetical protein